MRTTLPSGTPAELVGPPGGDLGLVVIPDIGGLRPLFDELVARLAGEIGGPVIAIELWPGREDLPLDQRLEAGSSISDERILGDALAAADQLGTARTGVVGFCMGGMFTYKAAATGRFDRAVPFYGMIRIPDRWRSDGQGEPLEQLGRAEACPVLAIIGDADPWTPPDDVAALEALPNVEVVRYPDAEHGFAHDPSRPAHRPDDAADAWRRALEFLRH